MGVPAPAGEITLSTGVGLISDVLNVSGVTTTTGKYGLSMSYSQSALDLLAGVANANEGGVYVAWYSNGTWDRISTGAKCGSYNDSLAVGSWGINTSTDTIWVVTNHAAGSFAVVPEPGTLTLLAGAFLSLIAYAWRKRKN